MATRRKTTEETSVAGFDFDSIEPVIAERPAASFKPNPLKKWLEASIEHGYVWLELPAMPQDAAKEATNMLRRGALPTNKGGLDCGLQINVTEPDPAGQVVVSFRVKETKKARTYTAKDVRAWAESNFVPREDIYPRIKPEVSRAYRVANGYPVADAK